jgi:hypothetical protein
MVARYPYGEVVHGGMLAVSGARVWLPGPLPEAKRPIPLTTVAIVVSETIAGERYAVLNV